MTTRMQICGYMYRRFLRLVFALLMTAVAAQAVGEERECQSYLLFGAGCANHLDTYLSPMEYDGVNGIFVKGRERRLSAAKAKLSFHSNFQGTFTHTENPARSAEEWGGFVAYNAGWLYNWHLAPSLTVGAGGAAGTDLGFLYNPRNSNNPAQGYLSVELAAALRASYDIKLRRLPMSLRYEAQLPVIGTMFSPQYGQSYYEMYTGNRDHNVCFTYPGNALSYKGLLSVDFVFKRTTLRAGYLHDIRQSHVNGIQTHRYVHSFVLGYVRYLTFTKRDHRKKETQP